MSGEKAVSCIFPHSDIEFGAKYSLRWTDEEKISFNKGALRAYLTDILPNRKYAYHYAIHYEMNKRNKEKIKAAWEDHNKRLFPIPNHLLANGTRIYFFYKWEIVGDAILEEVIFNEPTSELSDTWEPETYPIILKLKSESIRIFPNNSISKEVMKKTLTEKTIKTLPRGYPILTEIEEKKLQKEIIDSVIAYSSLFS